MHAMPASVDYADVEVLLTKKGQGLMVWATRRQFLASWNNGNMIDNPGLSVLSSLKGWHVASITRLCIRLIL